VVEDYVLIDLIEKHPDDDVFNISGTEKKETAADIVVLAFNHAVEMVTSAETRAREEAASWGNSRDVRLQHATRGIPAFDIVLHIGGEEHCVNAMDSDHGPAWRMVVSLEEDIKAWAVYPGGQSGNPGSFHYDDFVKEWATGELMPLAFIPRGAVPVFDDEPVTAWSATQMFTPKSKR
jgi:penicillin amidase